MGQFCMWVYRRIHGIGRGGVPSHSIERIFLQVRCFESQPCHTKVMAAKWLREALALPIGSNKSRPSVLNTVPDKRNDPFYEMFQNRSASSSFDDGKTPSYIRMLQDERSNRSRRLSSESLSGSNYVVQQAATVFNDVPSHLRTDPHVVNEVPQHLRTDSYTVGRKNRVKTEHFKANYRQSSEKADRKSAVARAKERDAARKQREKEERKVWENEERTRRLSMEPTRRVRPGYFAPPDSKADDSTIERMMRSRPSEEAKGALLALQHRTSMNTPFAAVAMTTFAATGEKELSVMAGTEVSVLDVKQSDIWWLVCIQPHGDTGWVPKRILMYDGMEESRTAHQAVFHSLPRNSRQAQRLPRKQDGVASTTEGRRVIDASPSNRPDLTLNKNPIFHAICDHRHDGKSVNELDVAKDEIVIVTDCKQSRAWWYVHRQYNPEQTGWVPCHCLRRITDEERLGRESAGSMPHRTTGTMNRTFSFDTNDINNAPTNRASVSPHKRGGSGSLYAVKSIATPTNRKQAVAESGKRLIQDLSEDKILRRFVSKGGSEWIEAMNEEGDGFVYHNAKRKGWTEERPTSANALRRLSSENGSTWTELKDDGGRVYYYNTDTGTRTIRPPTLKKELERIRSGNGSMWEERLDTDSGASYWYNVDKAVSSWSRPARVENAVGAGSHEGGSSAARAPECIICMDHAACVALIPCWHATYCAECAEKLQECPQCKQPVEERQKFFM